MLSIHGRFNKRGNHFPRRGLRQFQARVGLANKDPQRYRQPVGQRCDRCRHQQYPARDVECRKCHHIGHFAVVCHTKSVQEVVVCRNDEAPNGDK